MTVRELSKKELCVIFGLYAPRCGQAYYSKLRKKYFTQEALTAIEMSNERYKKAKTFNFPETQRIIEYFKIEDEELEV